MERVFSYYIFRYHYWLLYRLPEFPDPYNPPGNQLIAPVGEFSACPDKSFSLS